VRILMVVHSFPIDQGAGTENYTKQLCAALQTNHDIAVLTRGETFFNGPGSQIYKRENYPLPVYSYFRHPLDHKHLEQEYWNPDRNAAFETLLKNLRPDVVHFQHCVNLSMSMLDVAFAMNIPVYYTLHDFWLICPDILLLNPLKKSCCSFENTSKCRLCMSVKYAAPRIWLNGRTCYKLRRSRMISALAKCKKVLALSKTLQNVFVRSGFSADNIENWESGIDISSLRHLRKAPTRPSVPVRFGYTGTLSPQKGIDVLLKAFYSLPQNIIQNAELSVYGNMNADAATKRRVKKWRKKYSHPSIRFMGSFSPETLPNVQKNLDVVIVPSTWYENRPLSILESFASGNPVICSNLGGMSELVEASGAGWIFQPGNARELANILQTIITHPDRITERRHCIPDIPSVEDDAEKHEKMYLENLGV
jgi:glycosyltransferase involved in cell wall biosynthesis